MSDVLQAIEVCRSLVRQFIAGSLDYGAFKPRMDSAMGPFDPLDQALESLPPDQQKEAAFYVEWTGGEFGETEHLIPRQAGWVYGESDEPWGWVDQQDYRRRLRAAFDELLGEDI